MTTDEVCSGCGQLNGIQAYDDKLWNIYDRTKYANYERLVFTSDWLQENVMDEEDEQALNLAMERDMVDRKLCPNCGRPDLTRISKDEIMSEEDAKAAAEMYAEQASERRMGC